MLKDVTLESSVSLLLCTISPSSEYTRFGSVDLVTTKWTARRNYNTRTHKSSIAYGDYDTACNNKLFWNHFKYERSQLAGRAFCTRSPRKCTRYIEKRQGLQNIATKLRFYTLLHSIFCQTSGTAQGVATFYFLSDIRNNSGCSLNLTEYAIR